MPPVTRPVVSDTSDPVLETQVFWVKHQREILLVLAGLVIAGLLVGGYVLFDAHRQTAAATLLSEAKTPEDYQKVIAQYPSAGASVSAALLLAEQQRSEKKFADANATLNAFVGRHPRDEFAPTAKMAMAGNLESLGKNGEALEMYRRIAADHPRNYNAPFALLAQVHLLREKGKSDDARRVCETVMTQYRESYASTEAQRYLRTLKPTATVAPNVPVAPSPTAAP